MGCERFSDLDFTLAQLQREIEVFLQTPYTNAANELCLAHGLFFILLNLDLAVDHVKAAVLVSEAMTTRQTTSTTASSSLAV